MKKILAVVLSAIMLFCCIPFMSTAVEEKGVIEITGSEVATANNWNTIFNDKNIVIEDGGTLTIAYGSTIILPDDITITINKGGKLVSKGPLVINNSIVNVEAGGIFEAQQIVQINHNAKFYAHGKLIGAEYISVAQGAEAYVYLSFENVYGINISKESDEKQETLGDRVVISYGISQNGNLYDDLTGNVTFEPVPFSEEENEEGKYAPYVIEAPLNQYFYIKADIIDPEDEPGKFDDSLFKVYVNEFEAPFSQGSHPFIATSSGNVTYSVWKSDYDFLKTYRIHLPSDDGYKVYGRSNEQSALGETVELKYGQPFSFRVEVDPEYDMSVYEVYIYNGYGWIGLDPTNPEGGNLAGITPVEPDEWGYYNMIIKGDSTVYVTGIMPNETLLMVGGILDMVRNIFEMFAGFFGEILSYLSNILGGIVG